VKILTNAPGLPAKWTAFNGEQGETIVALDIRTALKGLRESDLVMINSNPRLLLQLSATMVIMPWRRRPLLGCDIVLREPNEVRYRLLSPFKRFLLSRVDHFMHLFKDLTGYKRVFGIGPERSSFTAFKPNLRYKTEVKPNSEGGYVLCLGWSMRDFDTFFLAMEKLAIPGAIAKPDFEQLRRNGSKFTRRVAELPKNVSVLEHDPKSYASQAELISGAKLVVVPLLKSCLVMAGTPYNAMLLGKCVVLTSGPAINGLFEDGEVIPVPAEDPDALASAIERAWNDDELRRRVARAGYQRTLQLGGEPELAQRMIDQAVRWYRGIPTPPELTCFTLDDASQK
jgi:glycosyltransferase involved in cell wall biosynthesis